MHRNQHWLLVFVLFVAAALLGCGGNGASPDQPTPGNDAEPQPDVIGQDSEVPDAGDGSDVNIPEVGNDADTGDEQTACTDQLCDACSPEGAKSSCSQLICMNGLWVMSDSDGGVANAPCIDQDAGDASDSDVGQDADAGDEPDVADAGDADAGQDATDTEAEADAPAEAEPPPPEICDNNIDDDFDGLKDCFDSECPTAPNCQSASCDGNNDVAEGFACNKGNIEYGCSIGGKYGKRTCGATCQYGTCVLYGEVCDDGLDNDYDGKRDCADSLCTSAANCQCISGVYMGDPCNGVPIGTLDCSKTRGCNCWGFWDDASDPSRFNCPFPEGSRCADYIDNDQDGKTDCQDPDCHDTPPCKEVCNDGVDNDLDGLADCIAPDCFDASVCILDTCNGLDDNHDGIVDNGAGMQCAGTANNTRTCTTTCGSVGVETCSTTTCTWGACTKPAQETKCTDGIDDDCNGYVDCFDPNCWNTPACPHNWGPTCQPIQPGDGLNCSAWEKEVVDLPGADRVFTCCDNSENDRFCLVGSYNDVRLIHKTSVWTEVALPVAGDPNGGVGLICLGLDQVYMTYNQKVGSGGVFAWWNGSNVNQLAAGQLSGKMGPIFGKSATDIVFVAYEGVWIDAKIRRWDGSTLTTLPLPVIAPYRMLPGGMWGMTMQDLYMSGSLVTDNQIYDDDPGFLMHYDGTSWALIQTPQDSFSLGRIAGTSACDIMITGSMKIPSGSDGLTLQKNGDGWTAVAYPDEWVASITKISPLKYILFGGRNIGTTEGRIGTSNGDFSVTWVSPEPDPLNFYAGNVSWRTPNTNKLHVASEGSGGIWIFSSVCQ